MVKRKEILNSNALKRRFIKDCNLPINITDNPYFEERLHILNATHNAEDKFNNFVNSLQSFLDEQEYFAEYTRIKEAAMDRIKSSDGYDRFIHADRIVSDSIYPKVDLYKEYNDNSLFVSIDMKQANFSAMNYFDPSIFTDKDGNKSNTWEDFIRQFTDNEHIIHSKYIREVIMGNCNPKRQVKYEHQLMCMLADHLINTFPTIGIYSVKSDEILINNIEGLGISRNALIEAINNEPNGIGRLVRLEIFEAHKNKDSSGWLLEYYGTDEFKLKCIDADTYIQYLKHYLGLPITENDLAFRHNGKLARFLEEVENPYV